jgi:hypothetical protein
MEHMISRNIIAFLGWKYRQTLNRLRKFNSSFEQDKINGKTYHWMWEYKDSLEQEVEQHKLTFIQAKNLINDLIKSQQGKADENN